METLFLWKLKPSLFPRHQGRRDGDMASVGNRLPSQVEPT